MRFYTRLLALAVSLIAAAAAMSAQTVTLTHVHGLAFTADGKQLMIPSHHGLAIYSDGRWSIAPGPQHDYMGFSATRSRLYSSGHPAPGSGLVNPFGLIRSDDGGRTWKKLGLEGETDFHVLATSYETHVVYVYNPAPNSRMQASGLHKTLNDGFMWIPVRGAGIVGNPRALAVHPTESQTVVAATPTGLFLSEDGGEHFRRIAEGGDMLAATFDLDGRALWLSAHDGRPRLGKYDLKLGTRADVAVPVAQDDAILYIAQSPTARHTYAIATFARNVFLSEDSGKTWRLIADRGQAVVP